MSFAEGRRRTGGALVGNIQASPSQATRSSIVRPIGDGGASSRSVGAFARLIQ